MNTLKKLVVACICTSIIYACGGGQKQNTSEKESNKDLERVGNISVDVTDDCIQVYENSFCRATTANIDGVDYMVAYSDPLHCIDLIALNGTPSFQQIKLEKQGPNGAAGISGIFYYDNTFVLKTGFGFCRVDKEGKIISKWLLSDYLGKSQGYGQRFPEQFEVFNFYRHLGFDEKEGLVAQPLYKYEKVDGQYPTRILILSCKDWQLVDEIDLVYPEKLKQEKWLGCLGEVQALPHGDKVIYNFPASSDIYVYDRKTKTTQVHSIAPQYMEAYLRCEDEQDSGLSHGYFMPIRYDYRHNSFWRVQQRKVERGIANRSFSVTQLTSDFEVVGEYDIPEKKSISSFNILFTDDKVLFPYMGGDYIGENNIAFYGLNLNE